MPSSSSSPYHSFGVFCDCMALNGHDAGVDGFAVFLPLLLLRVVRCLPFGSDSTLFFSSFYYIIMYSSVIVFGIYFFLYRRYFFRCCCCIPALLFLHRAPVFTIGLHNLLPSCLLIIMCKLNIAYRIIGEVSRSPRYSIHASEHTLMPNFVAAIVFSHIVLLLPLCYFP